MASNTTSYSFLKPTVGGDTNLWGGYLNTNWDDMDDLLDGTSPVDGIDIDGGSIDGTPIGGTTAAAGAFTTLAASGALSFPAGSIVTADIADSAVTSAKINNAAVSSAKLGTSAVTTTKINDAAVTTAKLNDEAVTAAKLAETYAPVLIAEELVTSNQADVEFTLDNATYYRYDIHFRDVFPDVDSDFEFQLDTDGLSWGSGGQKTCFLEYIDVPSSSFGGAPTVTRQAYELVSGIEFPEDCHSGATYGGSIGLSGTLTLWLPDSGSITDDVTFEMCTTSLIGASGLLRTMRAQGFANIGFVVGALRFVFDSAADNIASGLFKQYGYKR